MEAVCRRWLGRQYAYFDKSELYRRAAPALQYAHASLRADKSFVTLLVQENAHALEFADASCRADKDVVIAAVTQDPAALAFAHESLKRDEEVLHCESRLLKKARYR